VAEAGGVERRPAAASSPALRCSLNRTGEERRGEEGAAAFLRGRRGAPNPLPFWGMVPGGHGLLLDQPEGSSGNSQWIFRVRWIPAGLVSLGWTVGRRWFETRFFYFYIFQNRFL